jgi:phosphoribosyl 1,2-cyclic phosphodiesterase
MIITFYGVRGSTAAPGPETVKYGGNTSCVHIELDSGHDLILDAGTGIRLLGKKLASKSTAANILLSHGHWDHIQGYPFFAPIYQPDREIHVYINAEKGHKLLSTLFQQMDGTHFPVRVEDLPSNNFPKFKGIESELYEREGIKVVRQALNHPGGGSAYKIDENGASLAYVTDNELDPMFHHDPDRSDSQLDEIQIENQIYLKSHRAPARSVCAAEGMQIHLSRPILGGDTRIKIE